MFADGCLGRRWVCFFEADRCTSCGVSGERREINTCGTGFDDGVEAEGVVCSGAWGELATGWEGRETGGWLGFAPLWYGGCDLTDGAAEAGGRLLRAPEAGGCPPSCERPWK